MRNGRLESISAQRLIRGTVLTAENLAAEFGPRSVLAQQAIGAIRGRGETSAVRTYYTLIVECLSACVTGGLPNLDKSLGRIAEPLHQRLSEYRPATEPADVLKDLYLQLFPAKARRALGEYYTPDWLAEKLLADTLGDSDLGDATKRVLDPACGSGMFLVLVIRSIRRRVAARRIPPRLALDLILRNVIGFDVNTLAVQAARTNYLLALGDLIGLRQEPVEVPVYQGDLILAPPHFRVFDGAFDYIVGNPPWINWQDLPESYRREAIPLWEFYGLFPKRRNGMETILGAAKYDLSMLMTYIAADRYMKVNGKLGFIVPQSLFKAAAAGQGFRRFRLPDGTPLAVLRVDDLVKRKPFDSAANRTATVVLQKGHKTEYPVEYRFHDGRQQYCWSAQPVAADDPASPWISARPGTLATIQRLLGTSPYRAREGANTGGANGVFWLEVEAETRDSLTVRNVIEGARTPVPRARFTLERGLVYPLLRGQNVARWKAAPERSILITHRPGMRLRAIPENEMARAFPLSFRYLKRFKTLLRERPAYRRYFRQNAPFYSLFNIGDYTFAPWKVVWREQALPFTAAVVDPAAGGIVIPDHKLMLVAAESESEAHYLCGALNSLPVSTVVAAYAIETQIDTHVLDHISVPRFNAGDRVHRDLAAASRRAHDAVRSQNEGQLRNAEAAITRGALRLWRLAQSDLDEMRAFLREIGLAGASGCA